MRSFRLLLILTIAVVLLGGAATAFADTWYSVNDPIDPAYLTEMPFGYRSQWIQQWRAYLDTPPATTLADGMGINFNVPANQAQVAAQLLAASGIKRARVEIPWGDVSYTNPTTFSAASGLETIIAALRDNGIRPLILLDAHQGFPGPTLPFTATLTAAAAAGATSVQLDAATAARVVPGYTGLNIGPEAAGVIFTSVNSSDVATLSQPLPSAFAAGSYPAATLLYQPFAQPLLANGSPNPGFQATLNGWLSYVDMAMKLVTNTYGSDNFDVEIWNELGFDSQSLNLGNYYNPLPVGTQGNTDLALLEATVNFLHDPANGWPDVKVGNGFTNQSAIDPGGTQPLGVDAIDKHPYHQFTPYPWVVEEPGTIPLNAQGQPDYTMVNGTVTDNFTPNYDAFFPEWFLTGLQTETLTRDIAPITTQWAGLSVGRYTGPVGGTPPAMWITEDNMDPTTMNDTPDALTQSDYDHIHAKAALRTYVSYIGKGVQAVDLFAVDGFPNWNLVSPAFFTAAQVGNTSTYAYPGTASGGPTMDATRRLAATLAGAAPITTPRPLSLLGISSDSDAYQWLGDGTAAHPPLYDRDVLNFQPFQLTDDSWVAAVYVMTRDIAKVYNESLPSSDPTRTDLPPENFQITIGGVDAANLTATATDPLSGDSVPVQIIARDGTQATIQLPVTDSPRMVTLDDAPPASAPAPVAALVPTGTAAPTTTPTGVGTGGVSTPAVVAPPKISQVPAASRLSVNSRVVREGRVIYLRLECTAACRVSWSVHLSGKGVRTVGSGDHSVALQPGRSTLLRIATLSTSRAASRRHGSVSIIAVGLRGKVTIKQSRSLTSSLLA